MWGNAKNQTKIYTSFSQDLISNSNLQTSRSLELHQTSVNPTSNFMYIPLQFRKKCVEKDISTHTCNFRRNAEGNVFKKHKDTYECIWCNNFLILFISYSRVSFHFALMDMHTHTYAILNSLKEAIELSGPPTTATMTTATTTEFI